MERGLLPVTGSVSPLGEPDPFSLPISSDVTEGFLEYGGGGGGGILLFVAGEAMLILGLALSGGFTFGGSTG